MIKNLVCLLFFSSLSALAQDFQTVIYGEDNRTDHYLVTENTKLHLFASMVAIVNQHWLQPDGSGRVTVNDITFGEKNQLCSTERFYNQGTLSSCSGVLVGEDLVLTAGHCMPNQARCDSHRFAFGFSLSQAGTRPTSLAEEDIYACRRLVAYSEDEKTKVDFALIQLDRKVTNRQPVVYRREGRILRNEGVFMIGHPRGLPAKLTDHAYVRKSSPSSALFETNLDAMYGNSGSGVFNEKTGLLEGILVDGDDDFQLDEKAGCYVSKKCTARGCQGESVLRISEILPYLR